MLNEATLLQQNRRLRERNEELEETLRQMRESAKQHAALPKWLPAFTKAEEAILRELLTGRTVSRDRLHAVLYDTGGAENRGNRTVEVLLHRVRKKLEPLGVDIINDYARGWRLSDVSVAALTRADRTQ